MAKQTLNDTQHLNDEFTKIFDAYRARIDEITRRTQQNLASDSVAVATAPPPPPARQAPESVISRISPRRLKKIHVTPVSPPEDKTDISPISPPPVIKPDIPPVSPTPENEVEVLPVSSPPETKAEVPPTLSPPEIKVDIEPVSSSPDDKTDITSVSPPPVSKVDVTPVLPPTADKPDIPFAFSTPEKKTDVPPVSSPPATIPYSPSVVKLELPVVKESEAIIREAKRKAQRIIAETEEIIKKEAKKKTQAYVEKIIAGAQKEAEGIINKAAQSVDKERAEAVSLLKEESERLTKEITEKYTHESRQHSAHIITEAREQAAVLLKEVVNNSTEIGQKMDEIINRVKKTVAEFETKLQSETGELAKAISETQNKLLQVTIMPVKENPQPESPTPIRNKDTSKNPVMSVHLSSDNPRDKYYSAGLFSGQVEMKSTSDSFDYQYLKNLKKYLVHIPSIKYIQESASEREVSVLFNVKEPLPLVDILNHIPIIDKVITETDDDICLIFKSTE